jgi:hypothetical protein
MGALIIEQIRRYQKRIGPGDQEALRILVFGDPNGVVPGVIPPNKPGDPPFDIDDIFDDSEDPQDVAPANDTGDDAFAARRDHKHKGVHSLGILGSVNPPIFGDGTLSAGTGIELIRSDQDIRINNTGAGTGTGGGTSVQPHRVVDYYGPLTSSSTLVFSVSHDPIGDIEVYYDGLRKYKDLHYTQNGRTITFTGITPINGDRVILEWWWSEFESVTAFRIVEYTSILSSHSQTFNLLYPPFGDVQLYLAGLRKFKILHFTQGLQSVTFDPSISFIDGDLVVCEYWYENPYGGS